MGEVEHVVMDEDTDTLMTNMNLHGDSEGGDINTLHGRSEEMNLQEVGCCSCCISGGRLII